MLLTDAPTHLDAPLWQASCEAYADYLRGVSQLIEPYGILPSAVYEVDNTDYKNLYHEGEQVGLPSLEEYNAQVRNGIPLSKNFYLRRFPVAYCPHQRFMPSAFVGGCQYFHVSYRTA